MLLISKNVFINASCGFSVWILAIFCSIYPLRMPSSSNADRPKSLAMLVIYGVMVSLNSENLKVNLIGMETTTAIA